jgi:hypothetical protein
MPTPGYPYSDFGFDYGYASPRYRDASVRTGVRDSSRIHHGDDRALTTRFAVRDRDLDRGFREQRAARSSSAAGRGLGSEPKARWTAALAQGRAAPASRAGRRLGRWRAEPPQSVRPVAVWRAQPR